MVDLWAGCFGRHNILTYASAIALRALVALIPLTLLGLAILGAFGAKDVWRNQLSPPIEHRFTQPTYKGIDAAVEKILHHGSAGLLVFAGLLSVWDVSSVVRASMGAIDAIYEQEEERSIWQRFGLSVALGIGITCFLVGAILVVTVGRGLGGEGSVLQALLLVLRWAFAIVLLAAAVALLVHFAPTHRRAERWVGLGTLFVVAAWIGMTLLFGWFVGTLANFKTAPGQLTVFLVLTTYVYSSSVVFLVGVQLDELFRTSAREHDGVIARLRAVTGG